MYYCGWDGGGSKTTVCVTAENGIVLCEKTFGPINPNGTSADTVFDTIHSCIDFMASLDGGLDSCKGLVIGIAGASNRSATEFVEKTVRECGYNGKLYLTGDQEIAFAGAIDGAGAILIAGTGSVCFGRDENGNFFRCGGYGYLIDDEGSGYAIGRDILAAVIRAYDGRSAETALTTAVFEKLQIDNINSLISRVYAPETGKKEIASLAPLLSDALEKGDSAAEKIAEKAALNLAELVISAWKKADMKNGEVAFIGSILTCYDCIRDKVTDILTRELPYVKIVKPRYSPAQGAAKLALAK